MTAPTTLPPYVDLVLRCQCGLAWRWENVPLGESRSVTHNCASPYARPSASGDYPSSGAAS